MLKALSMPCAGVSPQGHKVAAVTVWGRAENCRLGATIPPVDLKPGSLAFLKMAVDNLGSQPQLHSAKQGKQKQHNRPCQCDLGQNSFLTLDLAIGLTQVCEPHLPTGTWEIFQYHYKHKHACPASFLFSQGSGSTSKVKLSFTVWVINHRSCEDCFFLVLRQPAEHEVCDWHKINTVQKMVSKSPSNFYCSSSLHPWEYNTSTSASTSAL